VVETVARVVNPVMEALPRDIEDPSYPTTSYLGSTKNADRWQRLRRAALWKFPLLVYWIGERICLDNTRIVR
jgi:hypothetical protein